MEIIRESVLFTKKGIKVIETKRKAKYVCDTEYQGTPMSVFYGATAHPLSHSRYMAFFHKVNDPYATKLETTAYVMDGSFIEAQLIKGIVTDDDKIIYSRHRHDYFCHGEVCIDGGRDYTRIVGAIGNKHVNLWVRDGVLKVKEDGDKDGV